MASYSGGSLQDVPVNEEAVEYVPLVANGTGGGEPVDPGVLILTADGWVGIQ